MHRLACRFNASQISLPFGLLFCDDSLAASDTAQRDLAIEAGALIVLGFVGRRRHGQSERAQEQAQRHSCHCSLGNFVVIADGASANIAALWRIEFWIAHAERRDSLLRRCRCATG